MATETRRDGIDLILTRYYAAFNAGDWQGMLDCLDDDVVHDINQGERQHGKAAFAQFLAHMERCYRERLEGIVDARAHAACVKGRQRTCCAAARTHGASSRNQCGRPASRNATSSAAPESVITHTSTAIEA